MQPVGFVGLGTMGRPMAKSLVRAGLDVRVFDVNPEAVSCLVEAGAKAASSVRELAAGSEVVITMLPSVRVVEDVILGPEGVLSACNIGTAVVDMSTVGPSTARKIAKEAQIREVRALDAPVSGGAKGAEAGTLTIMVGGARETFEACLPILKIMGRKIFYAGPSGAGATVKLVNNLLLGVNMVAVAEALVLGTTVGVEPKFLVEVVESSSGKSYAFESKVPGFILPRKFEPGFAIDLQYKDLDLAIEAGKEFGVPLPLTALVQQVFQAARAEGLGRKDISAVINLFERLAGVEVRGEV